MNLHHVVVVVLVTVGMVMLLAATVVERVALRYAYRAARRLYGRILKRLGRARNARYRPD